MLLKFGHRRDDDIHSLDGAADIVDWHQTPRTFLRHRCAKRLASLGALRCHEYLLDRRQYRADHAQGPLSQTAAADQAKTARRVAGEVLRGERRARASARIGDPHSFHDRYRNAAFRIVQDDDTGRIGPAAGRISGKVRHPLHAERAGPANPRRHCVQEVLWAARMDADLWRDIGLAVRLHEIGRLDERNDLRRQGRYPRNFCGAEQEWVHGLHGSAVRRPRADSNWGSWKSPRSRHRGRLRAPPRSAVPPPSRAWAPG